MEEVIFFSADFISFTNHFKEILLTLEERAFLLHETLCGFRKKPSKRPLDLSQAHLRRLEQRVSELLEYLSLYYLFEFIPLMILYSLRL